MRADVRFLLLLTIAMGWASSVFAAAAIAPATLAELPWMQISIGSMVSLWGGLTRTVGRLAERKAGEGTLVPLRVELARDLVTSAGCGFVTYMLGAWGAWNVWMLGVALFAGGYAGARYLDALGDALITRVRGPVSGQQEKP